ncbi:response regulator [Leptodesmis sichuanensis]|jgi:CheY-like chemotaxis protein|uniref:response regulator n=1 Tax=Leptodesmis sichuanensis TaxID=2906798 RepID=UPI001F31A962|nr:response regulator [Leptodesmis sichuanensis]UIE38317.1 response regulator [Leptodesmis sichuanensis A121]
MTKRILVVDDDQDIRDVAQLALRKFGRWDVTAAPSGQDGLNLAKADPPDAILLDVSMPDMDGISVFEQLQRDPATQQIPVVLLTAKVLPSDRQRFAALGVWGVITKPFDPVTLSTQVAKLLGW